MVQVLSSSLDYFGWLKDGSGMGVLHSDDVIDLVLVVGPGMPDYLFLLHRVFTVKAFDLVEVVAFELIVFLLLLKDVFLVAELAGQFYLVY